jgi:curved DNA-binding protein CbpA
MFKDFYKILEISSTATEIDIKKAYRKLALKYHPDRTFNDKIAEAKFREIQEAYEVLSNKEKKETFDLKYYNHYNQKEPKQANSQSEQKRYKETVKDPINQYTFLKIFSDLNEKVSNLQYREIAQVALNKSLTDLLSNQIISFIRSFDDLKTNREIINHVLLISEKLDFHYFERLALNIVKLAGADNDSIIKIHGTVKSRKKREFSNNIKNKVAYYSNKYPRLTGTFLIIVIACVINLFSGNNNSSDNNNIADTKRPISGDLYNNSVTSGINQIDSAKKDLSIANSEKDSADWSSTSYSTGSTPSCYNFRAKYDRSLDNRLEVSVGSNDDVVLKMINTLTDKCIRYVFIRSGDTFNITNIPQGKYYLKIAYGRDWRQKILNGKCIGRFIEDAFYKKGDDTLDFYKKYEGAVTNHDGIAYERYQVPSFSLKLDVIKSAYSNDQFQSSNISEIDFND